jgi:hypothetical protein
VCYTVYIVVKLFYTMSIIDFASFRQEFVNLELIFHAGYPIISGEGAPITAVVTPETATSSMLAAFTSLSKALNMPSMFNNFADVVYDEDGQLVWAGLPQVANYRDPQTGTLTPALIIGTNKTDKSGGNTEPMIFSQSIFPLEYDGEDYKLMGATVRLVYQPDNADPTKGVTKLCLEVKKSDTFYFRIRTSENYDNLKAAFDDGKFGGVIDSVSVNWFNATNFLKPTIEANLFPSGGIFMLLTNPKYSANEYNGTLLESIAFDVLKTTDGDLPVNSNSKPPVALSLGDVTNIKFNSNSKAFVAYQKGIYKGKSIILLHWIRPSTDDNGRPKSDHTPMHSIGTNTMIFTLPAQAALKALMADSGIVGELPTSTRKVGNLKSASPVEGKTVEVEQIPF